MNTTTRIPIVLMSVEETALAVSISVKTVRSLIRQGRLRAVNLGTRMTRIYLPLIPQHYYKIFFLST